MLEAIESILLSGDLVHHTIMEKRAPLMQAIDNSSVSEVRISMKAVRRVDSACLALMLDATRHAHQRNKQVSYIDVPASIKKLANFCSLEHILHI